MKRSEVLLKLQRYYSIRYCMVESGYITEDQFMDEVLILIEELGMVPPIIEEESWKLLPDGEMIYAVHSWENE